LRDRVRRRDPARPTRRSRTRIYCAQGTRRDDTTRSGEIAQRPWVAQRTFDKA
jgi:hypothetical protein